MPGSDGAYPTGALVQGSDGHFYRATLAGVAYGTVFSITPTGTLTTLFSFSPSNGMWANAPLVEGPDGDYYGTTSAGGIQGTVYKITSAGNLTTLYEFTGGTDGGSPNGGLILGTDGNFYGTAEYFPLDALGPCGCYGCGTVFKMTPDGTLTTLHSFSETDGGNPAGGLTQGTDGNFYGSTTRGGTNGYGTIFKLSTGLPPFVKSMPAFGHAGAVVKILGTDLTGATSVSFDGTAAVFTVVLPSLITTTVPSGASSGKIQVTTPSGTLSSNVP
jgi:uncharacterized repeat protein (TIGR03803 family)